MKFTISIAVVALIVAQSAEAGTNIVYGEDNRMEIFEAPAHIQSLAKSSAVMIASNKLIKLTGHYMLPPSTLKEDLNLCDGERFEDQISSGLCSGFLVGPDLLVTAGHCITSEFDCEKNSWVFDYQVNEISKRADTITLTENVFKCKRVVDAKLEMSPKGKIDYALIQLEKVAEGRSPLKYRSEGKIADLEDIFVLGYPSGLPQKYSPDAQLVDNSDEHFFRANLDTFGGNSGSSVINSSTFEVEGILVRGARDYEVDAVKRCRRVHRAAHQITDLSKYGESVTRITDIPALKYRELLMIAAKAGDIDMVRNLARMNVDLAISDNDNNTAIAYAVMGGHTNIVEFITKYIANAHTGHSTDDVVVEQTFAATAAN